MQPVPMHSVVLCIVFIFVMFVVDAKGDHLAKDICTGVLIEALEQHIANSKGGVFRLHSLKYTPQTNIFFSNTHNS